MTKEEAIKKIKDWNLDNDKIEVLSVIIPELKESEDEKIRKNIIEIVKQAEQYIHGEGVYSKEIAWLEKQGERDEERKEINLVEILKHYPKETELYSPLYGKLWLAEVDEEYEIITCYKRPLGEGCVRAILEQEDTVSFYSDGTTGLPDFTVSKDCMLFLLYNNKKQAEQKPNFCHHEVDFSNCSEEYRKAYYDGWNNCNQQHEQMKKQQKPTWSEEDEERYISCLQRLGTGNLKQPETINTVWLKSLKERVQLV